jgi:hypothetical protein
MLLATSLLLAVPDAESQTVREVWTTPAVIADGWWQNMAVDRTGTLHTFWYDLQEGLDALYYRYRQLDGTWSDPNDIFAMGFSGFTVRSSAAVSPDGMLNVVYRSGGMHRFSTAHVTQTLSAASWRPPVDISTQAYYADLTVDRNNVLHVVYGDAQFQEGVNNEFDPCFGCTDLMYRRSEDGGRTWTLPENLNQTPDTAMERPDIFEGASGRLYIIWDEGFDPAQFKGQPLDVRILYSQDGGLNWSDPIILDGGDIPGKRPTQFAMTELRNDELLAVWRYSDDSDRQIYHQVSSDVGATWTEPQAIPGVLAMGMFPSRFDDFELIVDRLGTAHLFVDGKETSDPDSRGSALFRMEYRQGTWWRLERIFYDPALQVNWPKSVVGNENDLHLTWFVSTSGVGYGESEVLQVYYSHRTGTLLSQPTQSFDPTRTPLPTPTHLQELVPTVTPLPTVAPFDRPVVNTTRDNYATQALVGGTVAAAVLCGGIIVFLRFLRR